MLSGLSNIPPITSITVNDTILRDVDLAKLVSESFSRVADDLPPPLPLSRFPTSQISILPLQKLCSLLYLLFTNASLWDQMKFKIGYWKPAHQLSPTLCARFITLPSENAMFLSHGKVRMSFHLGIFPNLSVLTPTLDLYPMFLVGLHP